LIAAIAWGTHFGLDCQKCEDALYGGHIILEGSLGLLDDGDLEAIPDKIVVNAPPAEPSAQAPWARTIFFTSSF
jgi:hypothetical protein